MFNGHFECPNILNNNHHIKSCASVVPICHSFCFGSFAVVVVVVVVDLCGVPMRTYAIMLSHYHCYYHYALNCCHHFSIGYCVYTGCNRSPNQSSNHANKSVEYGSYNSLPSKWMAYQYDFGYVHVDDHVH